MRIFKNASRIWPIVLIAAFGCGDTFTGLVEEEASLANELADTLLKVVDEPTATYYKEYGTEKIKNKLKVLIDRKNRFEKGNNIAGLEYLKGLIATAEDKGSIKGADYIATYIPVELPKPLPKGTPKPPAKAEIICNNESIYADIKMIANPESHENAKTITRRIDQQLARIDAIVSRMKAERPGSDPEWASLSYYKNVVPDLFSQGLVRIPKLPDDVPIKLKGSDPERDFRNRIIGISILILSALVLGGLITVDVMWKTTEEEEYKKKNLILGAVGLIYGVLIVLWSVWEIIEGNSLSWMIIRIAVGAMVAGYGVICIRRNSD